MSDTTPETPTCQHCKGDGSTIEPAPFPIEEMEATTCPECNGTGRAAETPTAGQEGDSVWMRTCIHHTDAQRNTANQCPVCILRERDALAAQLAQAQAALFGLQGDYGKLASTCAAATARANRLEEQLAQAQGEVERAKGVANAYMEEVREELTTAREECERLKQERDGYEEIVTGLRNNARQLHAEKEELLKDKARLDWLLDFIPTEISRADIDAALAKHQQADI